MYAYQIALLANYILWDVVGVVHFTKGLCVLFKISICLFMLFFYMHIAECINVEEYIHTRSQAQYGM